MKARTWRGPICFWHTGAPYNYGYSNRQVDAALDAIRHATDDDGYRSRRRRVSTRDRRRSAGDLPRLEGTRSSRQHAVRGPGSRARLRRVAEYSSLAAGRRRHTGPSELTFDGTARSAASRFRFALLLAGAAVLPLLAYGVGLARLAAARHPRVDRHRQPERRHPRRRGDPPLRLQPTPTILKALAADLQDTGLRTLAAGRIFKNYVLQFREFREITLFDEAGRPRRHEPRRPAAGRDSGRARADRSTACRCRRSASTRTLLPTSRLRHPPDAAEPAGRVAGRRVQPRRDVADGRSHPHRRARLRAGRRARRHADRPRRSGQEGAGRAARAT